MFAVGLALRGFGIFPSLFVYQQVECSRKWTFTLLTHEDTLPLEHHQGAQFRGSENLLTDAARLFSSQSESSMFAVWSRSQRDEYFRVCLCTSKWNILQMDIHSSIYVEYTLPLEHHQGLNLGVSEIC
ncbi:hypothetical protein AVEN_5847-1 [Araneus ventricosus]|uniref:Uncharacterized protein n=1 Tax=Araneus ventricosus TaxID=182803 RepID=A0A4Y2S4R9_ARAVE|nr:hypothetical protein AVEN_5847-1 [Araneus ventricosus]